MAGYRRQSAAEMEVQDYLAKAQAGLAGVNPQAQTLARSGGNPQAQQYGQELVAQQLQENAARREAQAQAAAERARQEAQAAEQRRQEGLRVQELRRQQQQAQRDAEFQSKADQWGAVTFRDPSTGRLGLKRHADGAQVFMPGPVGEPRMVPKVQETTLVDPANPERQIPTWLPVGDDGGVLGATSFADRKGEQEWYQDYRDERGQTTAVKLEQKTDPRTAETYYEKPSKIAGGAPERVVTGIDRRVKRLQELDRDGVALGVRMNEVQRRSETRAQEQAPLQAEYEAAKEELEAWRGNGWQLAGGNGRPSYWVRWDEQGNRLPSPTPAEVQAHEQAGSALRKRFAQAKRALDERRPEDDELARSKAQHEEELRDLTRRRELVDKGQPELSREQDEWSGQAEQSRREEEAEAKRLAAIPPPEPPKLMDPAKSPAAGDPDGRATVALAFGPNAKQPDLSAEATNYSGFHINRGGKWIANVEKNGAVPVITLREADGDEDKLREQAILHGSNGVPLYLRQNTKRKPIEQELEEVRRIYEVYRAAPLPGETEAVAEKRKLKELAQLGGLGQQVIERTRRGEISLDHGEALMRDLYGSTLRPPDPRSPKVFEVWLEGVADDEIRKAWNKDEHDVKARNEVRNQFVNWWYASNSHLPGVTRTMQARLRRELTGEKSEGFDENFSAFKKGAKSLGTGLVAPVLGMGLGLAEHSILSPLSLISEEARKQENELLRIQGRDGKNWTRGLIKNGKKYFTSFGSQERGDLIGALMTLKDSIDRGDAAEHYGYTDTPEKEAVARKAALQAVRDKAYAVHARHQEGGFEIRPEDVDPEQDPVLKKALGEYQATGDPAFWKVFERRLLQDRGMREHEDDMRDLTDGLDEFDAAVMSGIYAGPQELGMEALSWLGGGAGKLARSVAVETKLAALARRGGRFGEVASQLLRGQKMLRRIGKAGEAASAAEKAAETARLPFWQRLGKAALHEGKEMAGEAVEEMATEAGNPEMTPGSMLESGAMGALGSPLLKPVMRMAQAPMGIVAGWVDELYRGKKVAEFADWHNREMAGTPGFQPITKEQAADLMRSTDVEELKRLAEEHRAAMEELKAAEAEAKGEAEEWTSEPEGRTAHEEADPDDTELQDDPGLPRTSPPPREASESAPGQAWNSIAGGPSAGTQAGQMPADGSPHEGGKPEKLATEAADGHPGLADIDSPARLELRFEPWDEYSGRETRHPAAGGNHLVPTKVAEAFRSALRTGSGAVGVRLLRIPERGAAREATGLRDHLVATLVRGFERAFGKRVTPADVAAAVKEPGARQRLGDVRAGRLHALQAYRDLSDKKEAKGGLSPAEQSKLDRAAQALAAAMGREMPASPQQGGLQGPRRPESYETEELDRYLRENNASKAFRNIASRLLEYRVALERFAQEEAMLKSRQPRIELRGAAPVASGPPQMGEAADVRIKKKRLIESSRNSLDLFPESELAIDLSGEESLVNSAREGVAIVSRYFHPDKVPKKLQVIRTTGIRGGHLPGMILINESMTPLEVAHEIAHEIEFINDDINLSAFAFLKLRGQTGGEGNLAEVTGLPYEVSERALLDRWWEKGGDPYSGKICAKVENRSRTETLTVGLERLHSNPLLFLLTDPEYFDFVISNLKLQ